MCVAGYYLSGSTCYQISTSSLTISYFVTSSNYVYLESDYDNMKTSNNGKSPDYPFTYLQEAFYAIYKKDHSYTELNVTIYIGKGSHYFFICEGSEDDMYDKSDMAIFSRICEEYNLQRVYPRMDN